MDRAYILLPAGDDIIGQENSVLFVDWGRNTVEFSDESVLGHINHGLTEQQHYYVRD
mgnify:CR=1 FL=1